MSLDSLLEDWRESVVGGEDSDDESGEPEAKRRRVEQREEEAASKWYDPGRPMAPEAGVWWCQEAPNFWDIQLGTQRLGEVQRARLQRACEAAEMPEPLQFNHWYRTAVFKTPGNKGESWTEKYDDVSKWFVREVAVTRPNLIVASNPRVLAYLLRNCDATHVRRGFGNPHVTLYKHWFAVTLGGHNCWVLPVPNPDLSKKPSDYDFSVMAQRKWLRDNEEKFELLTKCLRLLPSVLKHNPAEQFNTLDVDRDPRVHDGSHQDFYVNDPDRHDFFQRPVADEALRLAREQIAVKGTRFQVMDAKYEYDANTFLVYGRTEAGETGDGLSVCATVSGFRPGFYVGAEPPQRKRRVILDYDGPPMFIAEDGSEYVTRNAWKNAATRAMGKFQEGVKNQFGCQRGGNVFVDACKKQSFWGYQGKKRKLFWRIECASFKILKTIVEYCKNAFPLLHTYENHVAPVSQLLLHTNVYAGGWVEVHNCTTLQNYARRTSCDVELCVNVDDFCAPADSTYVGGRAPNAPLRQLSWDIETHSRRTTLPQPFYDPIACIGCTVQTLRGGERGRTRTDDGHRGDGELDHVAMFVVGTCAPIADRWGTNEVLTTIYSFRTEAAMLRGWARYVQQVDPDLMMGYNSKSFDGRYVINRGRRLGVWGVSRYDVGKVPGGPPLGRLLDAEPDYREQLFQTKARGQRIQVHVDMPGRADLDLLEVFLGRPQKLPRYTLNYVSQTTLEDRKADVPHAAIPFLYEGGADTRSRLCRYCVIDTLLPVRLVNFLSILYELIATARMVSCLMPGDLPVRGVQVKVFSALLRENHVTGHKKLIPAPRDDTPNALEEGADRPGEEDDVMANREASYGGAIVLPPLLGLWENIICLDYASLYPSIMRTHNISHDMELNVDDRELWPDLPDSVFERSLAQPCDEHGKPIPGAEPLPVLYVQQNDDEEDKTRPEGLLPRALTKMLSERKRVKREMKQVLKRCETDPHAATLYAILDGQQQAIKIICNSVYGACGAKQGSLARQSLAASVTARGQWYIKRTRDKFIERYPGTICVGGDTDSVFLQIPGIESAEKAEARMRELEEFAATFHKAKMKLEYEKIFLKQLILAKKRYIYIVKEPGKDPKIGAKGIETVRRDQIPYLQELLPRIIEEKLFRMDADDADVEGAREMIRDASRELLEGRVGVEKLALSTKLSRRNYKSDTLPNVALARRMEGRGDRPPELGERFMYVFTESSKRDKAYQRVETPEYALRNGIRIDYRHYLVAKMMKPLMRLMYHFYQWTAQVRTRAVDGSTRARQRDSDWDDARYKREKNKSLKKWLFGGLTNVRQQNRPSDGRGMLAFTRPLLTCAVCKKSKSFEHVCKTCQTKKSAEDAERVRAWMREQRGGLDGELERRMAVCRDCLAVRTNAEVMCDNNACPEFFPRLRAQIAADKAETRHQSISKLLDW